MIPFRTCVFVRNAKGDSVFILLIILLEFELQDLLDAHPIGARETAKLSEDVKMNDPDHMDDTGDEKSKRIKFLVIAQE